MHYFHERVDSIGFVDGPRVLLCWYWYDMRFRPYRRAACFHNQSIDVLDIYNPYVLNLLIIGYSQSNRPDSRIHWSGHLTSDMQASSMCVVWSAFSTTLWRWISLHGDETEKNPCIWPDLLWDFEYVLGARVSGNAVTVWWDRPRPSRVYAKQAINVFFAPLLHFCLMLGLAFSLCLYFGHLFLASMRITHLWTSPFPPPHTFSKPPWQK